MIVRVLFISIRGVGRGGCFKVLLVILRGDCCMRIRSRLNSDRRYKRNL